jgi:hypothetical protein
MSAPFARAALLALLVLLGSLLAGRDASAGPGMGAAAAAANAGLSACSSNSGKALYECVANVIDKMSNEISQAGVPATQGALRTAVSRLRAAVNKAQALSAISQCRALISAAIQKVRTIGSAEGWASKGGDGSSLQAISGVLSRAAALIQSKG